MQSTQLKSILEAGAILAGSARSGGALKLEDVLQSRLKQYYAHVERETNRTLGPTLTLDDLQVTTACEALSVVEQVQYHLVGKRESGAEDERHEGHDVSEELLGARDLAQLRTLLSLVFRWAINPWLTRICASIPTKTAFTTRRKQEVTIIDLTTVPDDYKRLKDVLLRLISLILPEGVRGSPNATVLSSTILDKHLEDLLRPSMALGWLPKSLASESVSPVDDLRPTVVRLMLMMPVSKCIAVLSAILSEPTSLPYVRKSCKYLMSRQLLRPDGVRGLFIALFAGDDALGEDAPLERMYHAAKVLQTVPSGMDTSTYFPAIVHQLLLLLSSQADVPPAHQRTAAFVVAHLLALETNAHHAVVSKVVLPAFHKPFLQAIDEATSQIAPFSAEMSPVQALATLQTFLTNTDPSPIIISRMLTPIIPSLYALSYRLDKIKSADPSLRTMLTGLLATWGRLIGDAEGIATLWLIVDGEGGEWQVDVVGEIQRVESSSYDNGLSFFTPEGLRRAEESGEFNLDANVLNLRPDPLHFVNFIKSLDLPEVAASLFTRLLEAYRESKDFPDSDPLKTLLYLQLVVQIQNQLFTGSSSISILKTPDHILSFVKHALESAQGQSENLRPRRQPERGGLGLEDLRIIEDSNEQDDIDEGDSDDDDAKTITGAGDDEMTSTAVNLLLSVLEANPDLSTENAPILDSIFPLLEKLAKEGTDALKTLAREARMVLIARLASSSIPLSSRNKRKSGEESPTDTYQKALKLLQDPLLPVRAHGLLLLRQLVSSRQESDKPGQLAEPVVDRALTPGILSIFLQSLQDDDSYIFLNAVQGLSAMVDGFGKEVLKGLVDLYSKNLDGVGAGALTQHDVDTRVRIGEALGQVIRRCGSALPKYVGEIAPSLIAVMRSSHLPTTLRTSAVSLLALCTNTSALAVLPWATDLFSAMIDLLQIESVPTRFSQTSKTGSSHSPKIEPSHSMQKRQPVGETSESVPVEAAKLDFVDFKPATKDPKVPILRRSALHLLALLTQAFVSQVEDLATRSVYILPGELMRRAKNTVGYVAATDEDGIVRVMAKEVSEGLDALAEAMLGL